MDGFEALEKIVPIIVFIIWIVFGVIMKGARKRPGTPPPAPSPGGGEKRTPPRKREGQPGSLTKAIRKVLEEVQLSGEQPEEQRAVQNEPEETVLEELPAATDTHRAYQELKEEPAEAVGRDDGYALSAAPRARKGEISRTTVRRGFIWSEILAPPLAFRNRSENFSA